jgi:16S rRNA (cytosine967-C5)-methyltransferase
MSLEDLHQIKAPQWLIQIFRKSFNDGYIEVLKSLLKPTWKYYLRVNSLRSETNEIIKLLKDDGIVAIKDDLVEDAVYIEGYEELNPLLLESLVIAKIDAAESTSEGANLYRPGTISIKNAEKGSKVSIVTPDLAVAAEGILMMDEKEFKNSKKGLVVKNTKPKFKRSSVHNLKAFQQGLIYPQSYPSILTIHELEPKENETIVDMCASPGGKLSHIIQMTKGKAKIIACDKSHSKINKIKDTLARLGFPEPFLLKCDSRYLDLILGKEIADKITLDPSCSDLGLRPRITFNIPKKNPKDYSEFQKQLLRAAYNLLKKGGILCYSVCTVSHEETYEIYNYAIEELKMEALPLKFTDEKESIHLFNPYKEDTPGYAIFKLKKV